MGQVAAANRKTDVELPNKSGFRDERLPYTEGSPMTKMELGQAAFDHEEAVKYFKKHPFKGMTRKIRSTARSVGGKR